jgi:PAS domain S-box-containing protein
MSTLREGNNKTEAILEQEIDIKASESLWEHIEKTYRASESRYRLLAENVTDVIWTMDMDRKYTYVSPSVVHMRGYTAEEVLVQSLAEVFTTPSLNTILKVLDEDFSREQSIQKDTRRSRTLELDQQCKNGSIICTETKLTFLRNQKEKAIGILGVTRDITNRKRMEEHLKQSELLASLGKMTAGIAHEVNNPLGSILLFSELMMKSKLPADTKKDLRVIHDEAKRAAKVMSDLLTYSLSGRNKSELLDLHQIIYKVIDMRVYTETVQNISVSLDLTDHPLYVYGDKSQLSRVFMNIMLNAEEAMVDKNGGNISIITRSDNNWSKISIADDGIGIPEENLGQIFYPFFTTKKIGEGTGLGLSTCYGIITSHGGLIHAENNDMGGVTIIVELPLTRG